MPDFITQHRNRFGTNALLGTTTNGSLIEQFSHNNNYIFGYNESEFIMRPTNHALFWTDRGASVFNKTLNFEELVERALLDFYKEHGAEFAIIASKTPMYKIIAEACVRLNLPAVQIQIIVDGMKSDRGYIDGLPIKEYKLDQTVFVKLMNEYATRWNAKRLIFCYEGIHIQITDLPIIHCNLGFPEFLNMNYCFNDRKSSGPANWCLSEKEVVHSIYFETMRLNKKGIPNFWSYYPDFLEVLLDNQNLKQIFMENSPEDAYGHTIENINYTVLFPKVLNKPLIGKYDHNLGIVDNHDFLENLISKIFSAPEIRNNILSTTPLNRLLEKFNIVYDFYYGEYANTFGNYTISLSEKTLTESISKNGITYRLAKDIQEFKKAIGPLFRKSSITWDHHVPIRSYFNQFQYYGKELKDIICIPVVAVDEATNEVIGATITYNLSGNVIATRGIHVDSRYRGKNISIDLYKFAFSQWPKEITKVLIYFKYTTFSNFSRKLDMVPVKGYYWTSGSNSPNKYDEKILLCERSLPINEPIV